MRFVTFSAGLASWAAVANAGACYPCRKLQCAVALRAAGILDKSSVAYSECAAAMAAHSAPAAAVTNTVTATATAYADAPTASVTDTFTVTVYAENPNESVTVTSIFTDSAVTATETATTSTVPIVYKVSAIPVAKRRSVRTAVEVPASLQLSCTSVDEYLAGCACFNVQPTGAAAVTTTVTSTVSRGPTAATVTVTSSVVSFLQAGPTSTATVESSETSTLSLGPTATVTSTATAVVTSIPSETVTATSTVVEQAQTQTLQSFLLQPTDESDAYVGFRVSETGIDGFNVIVRDRAQAITCTYHGNQDGAASQNNYVVCAFNGKDFYFTQTAYNDALYGATAARMTQVGDAVKPACHFDDGGVLACSDMGKDYDTDAVVQRTRMRFSTNPEGYYEVELVAPYRDMAGYKELVLRAVPV
ncbi:hypothetical protein PG993_011582 [Apiospora rasikravindrae]|uniref:Uncharacterized protein n=1 Tax=Apiospora rasikravindrae TaxID=990691 RepID=A0ABR1S012_9PEZI